MATEDSTPRLSEIANSIESIDMFLGFTCPQIESAAVGALALLPDEDGIYRGLALQDRFGPSPEQKARLMLCHSIKHARTILEGIRPNIQGLHNDASCALEQLSDQLGVVMPRQAERMLEVAKLSGSTTH